MSTYYAYDGETSTGITLLSNDVLHVSSAGTASSTTVSSVGWNNDQARRIMNMAVKHISVKAVPALKRTARRATALAIAFLAAVCLTAGAMTAEAKPSDSKASEANENEPRNGYEYVKEKAQAWAKAYNELSGCVASKIPKENETYAAWRPEEVYTCKPELDEFRKARMNVPGWPQNLVWGNGLEKTTLTNDSKLIDNVHTQIVAYYNYLVTMNRESKQYAIMCWYRNMDYWYNDNGKKYKEAIKTIDGLITEYYVAKNKGSMTGGHYEGSPDAMKGMRTALQKLSRYFHYNVDSTRLAPCNKGVFLYDLDAHSVRFKEHRDDARRLMESTLSNLQKRAKDLRDSLKPLALVSKTSPFYKLTSTMPRALARLTDRMESSITRVRDGMEALADKSSPIGALLSQADLQEYTHFALSPKCSYIDCIRHSLHLHLLNTKDSGGNPLKHNIRGQL